MRTRCGTYPVGRRSMPNRGGNSNSIYTGTINSYYAGAKADTITEQTPLDRHIRRRNHYARGKAAAEAILVEMQRLKGLPLVIFRPGIVSVRGGTHSTGASGGGFRRAFARSGVMGITSCLSCSYRTLQQRSCVGSK